MCRSLCIFVEYVDNKALMCDGKLIRYENYTQNAFVGDFICYAFNGFGSEVI